MKKFVVHPKHTIRAATQRRRNAIYGDPTITWNRADEERYDMEGPDYDNKADVAANVAYVLDSVGVPLYAYADENEDGEWLIDIKGDGKFKWYVFVGGTLHEV